MRRNKLLQAGLFPLLLFAWACSPSLSYKKIPIEIPAPKPVPLDEFKKIAVTDFWITKSVPDLDLNREMRTYWRAELARQFEKTAVLVETPFEAEPAFGDPAFWPRLLPDGKETLLLTGKAQLTQETRKVLSEDAMKDLDGPFEQGKKLLERKVVTLELSLFLLRAETGDVLYKKEFKETKTFENTQQPASFAFFELLHKVKLKFVRAVLGESRAQDRFLISE